MAGTFHDNDVGPFASVEYTLAHGGPGLQELDLKLRDRDVLLVVELDRTNARALHLHNVRADTLTEAKSAVDKFLNQLEPLNSTNSGHTVFQMFDRVQDDMTGPVDVALGDIDDLRSKLTEINQDELKYPKKKDSQDLNPVSEIIEACYDFLARVRSVQSKSNSSTTESNRKRDASVLTRALDMDHLRLEEYMQKKALESCLGFNWYTPSYPEHRRILEQPKYRVYHDVESGGWLHAKGSYGAPPESTREQ
ncbi:unnamed protein product [Clonostachys rosea]|uniref:Uncharacterized protein n=1 Tax=Bionectria ochroleuca TaxID=29856 RepID=A0ABY6UEF7_BIOOC|nr:unnamed protein product [Clonostachys rosea]